MDMWMQQWGLGEDIIVNKEAARCGKSESTS
jgi:hypothetical protein